MREGEHELIERELRNRLVPCWCMQVAKSLCGWGLVTQTDFYCAVHKETLMSVLWIRMYLAAVTLEMLFQRNKQAKILPFFTYSKHIRGTRWQKDCV